jgi:hypothetical protein
MSNGTMSGCLMKKTRVKKSRDTVPLKGLISENYGGSKVVPIDRYQCSVRLLDIFCFLFKGTSSFKFQKIVFSGLRLKNVAYPFPWGSC